MPASVFTMREVYTGTTRAGMIGCYGSVAVQRLFVVVTMLTIAGSGCVTVRAHQRENLSKRAMTSDRDPGEVRFGQHERGSREGADGGTGQPGGGCGCN
jgi:Domain of unknown function (DUF4266)